MKIIGEFKKFISRGNVIDMAVGVIMGTAFTKIVNSLVTSVITPAMSILTGKVNIAAMAYKVNDEISIAYGEFLQAIIDFLLVAICIFAIVTTINKVRDKLSKKEEEAPKEPPKPSEEVLLLTEIRDLLKK
ncbi:MAG: large-conductance mechanosensitive channel protein MscL [Ruminococcaceae bacterium]|nr:large-conductance mechanosensitive channel protein MscL [Oscillospiraceae bacterium]